MENEALFNIPFAKYHGYCGHQNVTQTIMKICSTADMHAISSISSGIKGRKNFAVMALVIVFIVTIAMRNREREILSRSEHRSKWMIPPPYDPHVRCDATYYGCFPRKKGWNRRVKNGRISEIRGRHITRASCIESCSDRGLRYCALANDGSACGCAKTANLLMQMENCAADCDTKSCADDAKTSCAKANAAINLFFINRFCFKGNISSEELEERRIGEDCQDPDEMKVLLNATDLSSTRSAEACVLQCDHEHHPVAAFTQSKRCVCGRISRRFNSTSGAMGCEWREQVQLFRTSADDERCGRRTFPPAQSQVVGLVSFPGSGNTWLRHLIELASGHFTGSVYGDKYAHGMITQGQKHKQGAVVKDHLPRKRNQTMYSSFVLLLRNPYDAWITEYMRRRTKSHTSRVETYKYEGFRRKARRIFDRMYAPVIRDVIGRGRPVHVVVYEQLKRDPAGEIRRMLPFLGLSNNSAALEERLMCLLASTRGANKRSPHQHPADLYDRSLQLFIDRQIATVRELLPSVRMPVYERTRDFVKKLQQT